MASPEDPRTDAELMACVGRGDADAMASLYRRHRDWTIHLAQRFVGNRDDALDVLQDAFTHLLQRSQGFRLTASLRAYLFPVVQHLSISLLRRRRKSVDLEEGERAVLPTLPDTDMGRLLARLPAGQQYVLQLRFVHDLQLDEIAEVLRIPVGTVKSRLHGGLAELRRLQRG